MQPAAGRPAQEPRSLNNSEEVKSIFFTFLLHFVFATSLEKNPFSFVSQSIPPTVYIIRTSFELPLRNALRRCRRLPSALRRRGDRDSVFFASPAQEEIFPGLLFLQHPPPGGVGQAIFDGLSGLCAPTVRGGGMRVRDCGVVQDRRRAEILLGGRGVGRRLLVRRRPHERRRRRLLALERGGRGLLLLLLL